jgi:hypothetical protein
VEASSFDDGRREPVQVFVVDERHQQLPQIRLDLLGLLKHKPEPELLTVCAGTNPDLLQVQLEKLLLGPVPDFQLLERERDVTDLRTPLGPAAVNNGQLEGVIRHIFRRNLQERQPSRPNLVDFATLTNIDKGVRDSVPTWKTRVSSK